MKRKIFSLIMAGFAVLMTTACGRKTEIKFTETESEEAISGDITRFNKVIAGTPINEQESLYDCTDILVKEGYQISNLEISRTLPDGEVEKLASLWLDI